MKINRDNIEWVTTFMAEELDVRTFKLSWVNLAIEDLGISLPLTETITLHDNGVSDYISWDSANYRENSPEPMEYDFNMADWADGFLDSIKEWDIKIVNYTTQVLLKL